MGEVIELDDQRPIWTNFSCACLTCGHRWIATAPASVDSTKLECPACGAQTSFALEVKE